MHFFLSQHTNPYQNLATEEYLLKNCQEDYLFVYRNQPCVVVGKHQIVAKEINSNFTYLNNILIARRLSGGGAVYHDEGNLNFCFIRTTKPNESISYQILTGPLYDFLRGLGIHITLTPRNDFILSGKKVSGSAMHVYKDRVMAHCTLLVSSNLISLSQSLKSHPERFSDKSIRSVRSAVMNLSTSHEKVTVEYLLDQLTLYLAEKITVNQIITSDKLIYESINQLAVKKYSTTEWIVGYSPRYTYRHSLKQNHTEIKFRLEVEKGIITEAFIESEDEITDPIRLLFKNLIGIEHSYPSISTLLKKSREPEIAALLPEVLF